MHGRSFKFQWKYGLYSHVVCVYAVLGQEIIQNIRIPKYDTLLSYSNIRIINSARAGLSLRSYKTVCTRNSAVSR